MPAVKSVDEMISELPRVEKVMVNRLRELVGECLPAATEKPYYGLGVPFYKHHRLICFIWPASVFWGVARDPADKTRIGVTLGFCQGNLMANDDGALRSEGRKQVYTMFFNTLKDIKDDQVRALLFEAGMIDDGFGERKRRRR